MREVRQQEAVDSFYKKGLIKAAPRFGKIKVAIDILQRDMPTKILIAYPRVDIKTGWISDFEKFKFGYEVHFQTFKSIQKEIGKEWDFIIIDEIHEASPNQLINIGKLAKDCNQVLALSGTCTGKTLEEIFEHTELITCYSYPISTAVEEGILCDYEIFVHQVPLDTKHLVKGKSEKKRFDALEWVKDNLKKKRKPTFYLDLRIIQLLQHSYAKLKKTKELLKKFEGERVLVFCGLTEIADDLGIPVYHSKSKEAKIFLDFCTGKGEMLATIKMAQSGITVLPINKGVINYTSGNPEDTAQKICRFLGFEYDNPDKKAEIHLISSDEHFEKSRLKTSLLFFDESKINYVKD